jgi:hypothetical protein
MSIMPFHRLYCYAGINITTADTITGYVYFVEQLCCNGPVHCFISRTKCLPIISSPELSIPTVNSSRICSTRKKPNADTKLDTMLLQHPVKILKGQELQIHCSHDDFTLSFHISSDQDKDGSTTVVNLPSPQFSAIPNTFSPLRLL